MLDDGLISEEKVSMEVFCDGIMLKWELGQWNDCSCYCLGCVMN